jgi:hypothetical protein
VNGTVNPEGTPSNCEFRYGYTTQYNLRSNSITVASGTKAVPVTYRLEGLSPGTTFHYALVCSNASGSVSGQDVSFSTTSATGPSVIRLSGHTGFVSQSGVAGVFIGCYGTKPCTGSVTLRRTSTGNVVAHRATYFIPAQSGGIIHMPLSAPARSALRSLGHIGVTVSSTTTDGQTLQGGDAGRTLQLHLFR